MENNKNKSTVKRKVVEPAAAKDPKGMGATRRWVENHVSDYFDKTRIHFDKRFGICAQSLNEHVDRNDQRINAQISAWQKRVFKAIVILYAMVFTFLIATVYLIIHN